MRIYIFCDMLVHLWQVYGNNIEIQALSEIYSRPIHIHSYSTGPAMSEMK